MGISAPASFHIVCRMFHQDIDKIYPTIEEMANYAARIVPVADRVEVSAFIDHVLTGDYSNGELKALWRRSDADVYFKDGEQVRRLLRLMKGKLAGERSGDG
jgi:hypothetical protein